MTGRSLYIFRENRKFFKNFEKRFTPFFDLRYYLPCLFLSIGFFCTCSRLPVQIVQFRPVSPQRFQTVLFRAGPAGSHVETGSGWEGGRRTPHPPTFHGRVLPTQPQDLSQDASGKTVAGKGE